MYTNSTRLCLPSVCLTFCPSFPSDCQTVLLSVFSSFCRSVLLFVFPLKKKSKTRNLKDNPIKQAKCLMKPQCYTNWALYQAWLSLSPSWKAKFSMMNVSDSTNSNIRIYSCTLLTWNLVWKKCMLEKYLSSKKVWHLAKRQLLSSQMSCFFAIVEYQCLELKI